LTRISSKLVPRSNPIIKGFRPTCQKTAILKM
jgi:hypothetical protein